MQQQVREALSRLPRRIALGAFNGENKSRDFLLALMNAALLNKSNPDFPKLDDSIDHSLIGYLENLPVIAVQATAQPDGKAKWVYPRAYSGFRFPQITGYRNHRTFHGTQVVPVRKPLLNESLSANLFQALLDIIALAYLADSDIPEEIDIPISALDSPVHWMSLIAKFSFGENNLVNELKDFIAQNQVPFDAEFADLPAFIAEQDQAKKYNSTAFRKIHGRMKEYIQYWIMKSSPDIAAACDAPFKANEGNYPITPRLLLAFLKNHGLEQVNYHYFDSHSDYTTELNRSLRPFNAELAEQDIPAYFSTYDSSTFRQSGCTCFEHAGFNGLSWTLFDGKIALSDSKSRVLRRFTTGFPEAIDQHAGGAALVAEIDDRVADRIDKGNDEFLHFAGNQDTHILQAYGIWRRLLKNSQKLAATEEVLIDVKNVKPIAQYVPPERPKGAKAASPEHNTSSSKQWWQDPAMYGTHPNIDDFDLSEYETKTEPALYAAITGAVTFITSLIGMIILAGAAQGAMNGIVTAMHWGQAGVILGLPLITAALFALTVYCICKAKESRKTSAATDTEQVTDEVDLSLDSAGARHEPAVAASPQLRWSSTPPNRPDGGPITSRTSFRPNLGM